MVAMHGLFFASIAVYIAAAAGIVGNAVTPASEPDCKGAQCEVTMMPGDASEGTMLFQSGRSVTKQLPSGNAYDAGSEDSFDVFDEYDEFNPPDTLSSLKFSLAEQFAEISLPAHFYDPAFYFMAGFYGFVFAIVAKLLARWQAWDADDDEDEEDECDAPSAKVSLAPRKVTPSLGTVAEFEALAQAVRSGDEARCLRLVQKCNVATREDACGCTALHIAAQCDSPAIAMVLIKHGARVNTKEAWEETPLHIAAREGSMEVCKVLLDHGAEIDPLNANGRTPLLEAAHAGKEAVCEMLLDKNGGVRGAADSELPALLNALIVRRMFVGAKPQELDMQPCGSEDDAEYEAYDSEDEAEYE